MQPVSPGPRLPAPTPAPAPTYPWPPDLPVTGDCFTDFERLACASFSDLNVEVGICSKTDRVAGTSPRRYVLRVSGAALGPDRLEVLAASPAEAVAGMIRKVKPARHARKVWLLVEDCQSLVGGCLDEDFEARLHYELDTCASAEFETRAARFRAQAVAYQQQALAA